MKDTSKEVENIYNNMLLERTPEERLRMGCSMFDFACAIIESSFPRNLTDIEIKQQLFLRLYSNDLEEDVKKNFLEKIKKAQQTKR